MSLYVYAYPLTDFFFLILQFAVSFCILNFQMSVLHIAKFLQTTECKRWLFSNSIM